MYDTETMKGKFAKLVEELKDLFKKFLETVREKIYNIVDSHGQDDLYPKLNFEKLTSHLKESLKSYIIQLNQPDFTEKIQAPQLFQDIHSKLKKIRMSLESFIQNQTI